MMAGARRVATVRLCGSARPASAVPVVTAASATRGRTGTAAVCASRAGRERYAASVLPTTMEPAAQRAIVRLGQCVMKESRVRHDADGKLYSSGPNMLFCNGNNVRICFEWHMANEAQ